MNKFSIEKIVIEKSEKDIQIGVTREFGNGINLICGSNETGKSSLLDFIRRGFFKTKGADKGKIYFKVSSNAGERRYRADIQDNRSADLRCRIFDENNNAVNYNFIENTINKKYFEQGFTINLDDLMNIQNKDTDVLVNTIKDPAGEKLDLILTKIKNEAKKILGDNNRLTKETAGILEKINKENIKINELSNLETRYNNAVQELKRLNDELEKIYKQEEFQENVSKLEELEVKFFNISEQKNILLLEFNEALFNSQDKYSKIIQNAGRLEANKSVLQKNEDKTAQLKEKISEGINNLRSEYAINADAADIENFTADYGIIRKLKEIYADKAELEKELLAAKQNKENVEENLLLLKYESAHLVSELQDFGSIEKMQELYNFIDENMAEYYYLQSGAVLPDKSRTVIISEIIKKPGIFILFTVLFILTSVIAIICFINHASESGISAALTSLCLLIGIGAAKFSNSSEAKEAGRNKMQEILLQVKECIKNYSGSIDGFEGALLPSKINNFKTEIQNKIQNYSRMSGIVSKNTSDSDYNKEKLKRIEEKMEGIRNNIKELTEKAESVIKSGSPDFEIPAETYLEAAAAIQNLKEYSKEMSLVLQDIKELEAENSSIIDEFNAFISEMKININFSESYAENIQLLKAFNDKNSNLKTNIDVINAQLENINSRIELFEEKKAASSKYAGCMSKEALIALKNEKTAAKSEAEFEKRSLESFEGLNDLKMKKALLLEEYRKKIFTLAKDKMILNLIQTAKDGFDKIQPDLYNAQQYLKILTDGKYSKINLDLEEIQNADGSLTKNWNTLSRGTKEQVYLALRLGYASNYTKDRLTLEDNGKAALPLIIDDAFVNFDTQRTRQGIKCLIESAKTNQVIFFTCHNDVMRTHFEELCCKAGVKLNIINIG